MLRFLVLSLLVLSVQAQSTDLISALFSDARSIFTLVTSILGPNPATTTSDSASSTSASSPSVATATSTSASSTLASSTSAAPSSPPSITSAASTSSSATSTASSSVAAATSSHAAANGSGGSGGTNTLAIVLGCTLGALALAAFLGLLWLCLRRRRRQNATSKHRSVPPDDDEIESWRHEKPMVSSFKGPDAFHTPVDRSIDHAPLMTEEQAHHSPPGLHNPFVPVPPPARRSSRHGLEDTGCSAHPFSPDEVGDHHRYPHNDHHNGKNMLAAAAGGAALGGLAAHARQRHERNRSASRGRHATDPTFSEDDHNALPQAAGVHRRSGSVNRANAKEPWPYADETPHRSSMDKPSARRRSTSRSHEHFMTPSQHPWENEAMPLAGGALAGLGAGALAAHHHHQSSSASSPPKGILKQTNSDSTNITSSYDDSQSSTPFVDAPVAHNPGPHELASVDVPNTPTRRDRPTSALGTAAPVAAIGAVGAAAAVRARSTSASRTKGQSMHSTQSAEPRNSLSFTDTPSAIPPRSPKRSSMDRRTRDSMIDRSSAELPASSQPTLYESSTGGHVPLMHNPHPLQQHGTVSPPLDPVRDEDGIRSPVSPITSSNPGTWSTAQAEELGLGAPAQTTSASDTTVHSSPSGLETSDSSEQQSSGLVSAIQRIFSSQRTVWAEDEAKQEHAAHLLPDQTLPSAPRVDRIPHRKPAPQNPMIRRSQYGEIDSPYVTGQTAQSGAPNMPQSQGGDRRSIDSLPPRYQSRSNSGAQQIAVNDFAPTTPTTPTTPTSTHNHNRTRSRSGYGLGSGDPFDLARVRTDSSMTGISMSNYQEANHPPRNKTSSGSFTQREPTLAELRQQVQEEDRQRARKSWEYRHRRSGSSGLRYGDDRELFDLIDQTTGRGDYDNDNNRYYARRSTARRSGDVGRAM